MAVERTYRRGSIVGRYHYAEITAAGAFQNYWSIKRKADDRIVATCSRRDGALDRVEERDEQAEFFIAMATDGPRP